MFYLKEVAGREMGTICIASVPLEDSESFIII